MRNLLTAATAVGLAATGALVAPQAADAAGPLPDQLILCAANPTTVTVENLTDDSTGPQDFKLTGCQTIVDGSATNDSNGTPISATYRIAFEPTSKSNQSDTISILTDSQMTRTVNGEETEVRISALEGVQVTFNQIAGKGVL